MLYDIVARTMRVALLAALTLGVALGQKKDDHVGPVAGVSGWLRALDVLRSLAYKQVACNCCLYILAPSGCNSFGDEFCAQLRLPKQCMNDSARSSQSRP